MPQDEKHGADRRELGFRGADEQPNPVPNANPAIWEIVIADMQARDYHGRMRYRTPLQGWNGRDALRDAYEEALDLCVYLRQAIWERDEAQRAETPVQRETENGGL